MGGKSSKQGDGNNAQPPAAAASSAAPPPESNAPNAVWLNVYEPSSGSAMGGVYHSGLVLYDTEYMFAGGPSSLCGISTHRPRSVPDNQWKFYKSEYLGVTQLSREQVKQLISEMKAGGQWAQNTYNLTGKNCNHFTTALAKNLGLVVPGWVNRSARFAHALGMGPGDAGKQAVDHEGRPLRPEDAAALVMEPIVDVCVDGLLERRKIASLGNKPATSLLSIIPVDDRGQRTKLPLDTRIESDTDEQLLLFLPFTKPVKLISFLLRLSAKDLKSNPKTLKLFTDRPNMDFNDSETIVPTLIVNVPEKPEGRAFDKLEIKEGLWEHVVQLPVAKFHACAHLTIFVEDNHGAPTTKIWGLTLVGRDK